MSDPVSHTPNSSSHTTAELPSQDYKNHVRRDLPFLVAVLILVVNFCVVTSTAIRLDLEHFTWVSVLRVAVAFALVVIAMKARTNALKAQDRTIRLEERLRYAAILPPALIQRTESLTVPQIVALRFVSDPELPILIDRTLNENLTSKQIKQSITSWRPDHCRV